MPGKMDYIKKLAGIVKANQQGGRAFEMTHYVTDFDLLAADPSSKMLLTDPVTDQPVPVDISTISQDKPEKLQQSSLCQELVVVSPYVTPAERAKMLDAPYHAAIKTIAGTEENPIDKEQSEARKIFELVAERFKDIEIKIGKGNNFKSGLIHNLEMGQALIALNKSDEPRNLQFVRTKIRTARSDVRQRFGEIVFDPSRIFLDPSRRKKHYLFVALRFKIIKVSRKK